jgi:chromosome partitioning protein
VLYVLVISSQSPDQLPVQALTDTLYRMILTIASFKGGVGKSTTAIHLAHYFASKGKTALVDGDPNRSSTLWASRGQPTFTVVNEHQVAQAARSHEHLVVDTKARPDPEDLQALATGCDLLVLPCTPDPFSMDAMLQTVKALRTLGSDKYKILLTIVPPRPMSDGDNARMAIAAAGLPVFTAEIRRTVAFQRAALTGVTVDQVRSDVSHLAWMDYERVGEESEKNGKTESVSGTGRSAAR